ncbi:glycosyl hydrolase family 71 protein [Anopheles sinensis]|uniref:Glycosyl hydrolase family 71 protein n=1 Tax=Anopheles sinensis TaxID=74873 RepID=A0A084VXV1_ANOSI|nr:glycosyl hydrolase family 71 protein [Anopheles sinensis]
MPQTKPKQHPPRNVNRKCHDGTKVSRKSSFGPKFGFPPEPSPHRFLIGPSDGRMPETGTHIR